MSAMHRSRSYWVMGRLGAVALLIAGTPLPALAASFPIQVSQGQAAVNLSPEEMLRQVTVRIVTADNQGSGTLLAKQGNRYLVLTNRHGVRGQTQAKIQTADGQSHRAQVSSAEFQGNSDLALLEFSSVQEYSIPLLGNDFTPLAKMSLLVGG